MKRVLCFVLVGILALVSCNNKKENNNNEFERKSIINACEQVSNSLNKKEDLNDNNVLESYYYPVNDYSNVQGTKCFVYYLKLLYSDNEFPISDKPIKFVGNYVKDDEVVQYNDMALLSKVDEANNKIVCEAYGDSHFAGDESSYCYYYIDIDYDFKNEEVISYDLYIVGIEDDNVTFENGWILEKYESNILYEFKASNEQAKTTMGHIISNDLWMPYKEKLADVITLEKDYSNEYTKATIDVMGEDW